MKGKPLGKLVILGAACSAFLLSACSVLQPAPEPNQPLAELAASARGEHREQLLAEIARVCGHHTDATVPDSCSADAIQQTVDGFQAATDPARQMVDLFTIIPEDSRALVATQYVDVEPASAQLRPEVTVEWQPVDFAQDSQDIQLAAQGLQREFAVIYGLDVARGFADEETKARIDAAKDTRLRRIAVLEESLASTQEAEESTAPLAAYAFADTATTPVDAPTAAAAVNELLDWSSTFWINASAQAEDDAFAMLALKFTPKQ